MTCNIDCKTHFEKVCEFNKAFDYKVYSIHDGNPLETYPKEAKYRYDLIHEEGVVELGMAINNNDSVEIMDGLADLLYVLYGACYTYDLNPDLLLNTFNNMINEKSDYYNYYHILLENIEDVRLCLLEKKNIIELYSSLIKTIINTYQLSFSLKINIDKVFNIVHDSNMSKLCKTEDESKETVSFYETKYQMYINHYQEYCDKFGKNSTEAKTIYSPYDTPYYYKSGDYYLVKNKSTGKALKSINYTPVFL
jgi:predicted HAD superfamily Cof-like phosphohydrolase